VLAGSDSIAAAADNHSKWQLLHGMSHNETAGSSGFTGATVTDRMTNAGYAFNGSWWNGENIHNWNTSSPMTEALKTQMIYDQHKSLFVDDFQAGRGHRLNILNGNFQEVGIGQVTGTVQGNLNTSIITEDFGRSGSKLFVTGVVYNDTVVDDEFFSVGEQTVGRTVSGAGATDTTGAGGGYELLYGAGGNKTVTFDLSTGDVTVGITVGATNAKLDIVNGKQVWTDTSITSVSSNVKEIHALSLGNINLEGGKSSQWIHGNDGNNIITGHTGHDRLFGEGGADTFVFFKGDTSSTRSTADTIFDFSQSEGDKIDFSHRDANSVLSGDQEFTFIGSSAFHKVAGELHYIKDKSDTWIEGDTNGNGKADFIIHLDDAISLTKADFIL
jgi:Ca2+-binding RTX toxin-like protein